MDVLLVVGDQDSYHESEHEVVSSPIWLARILDEEGLTGIFVLHARRAEILAEQGRDDVIQALRQHEIGLHGRDIHPVLPEIVEGLGWHDGVDALLSAEGAELEELGRIFDTVPVCSSQHRHHAAPQIFGVARKLGLPYLFGFPAAPPFHSVSWYAGALNVPFNSPVPDFLGFFPSVFDEVLHDDRAFAALFERLRQHVSRCLEVELPLLVVFICHPERLCYSGPVEQWLYGNGVNHGRGAVPLGVEARRARAEVARSLANFRTLVRYLRDTPGLDPTTVREVTRRYGSQTSSVTREELASLAARATRERQIPIGQSLSAAETLLGFAESLSQLVKSGRLPATLARRDVLGPIVAPPLAPEVPSLDPTQIDLLADELLRITAETGHLPATLSLDGGQVGLGSLYGAFAETYLAAERGDSRSSSEIRLAAWPRYPALAVALGECHRRCEEDPLTRPGLSTDAAALHARLQTWTLKPAQRR